MEKVSNIKSDVAKKEEEVLAFWEKENIFQKSVDKPNPYGEYVFYDGPPFATGLPHYGHLLGSTVKDVIPRYQTMRGKKVVRTWGWDCHGLPIENIVEKELGISGKKKIEEYGIEKFNAKARESVLTFVSEWKKTIDRIGRWVDFEGGYSTMDNTYIESVWWALKEINEKGLLYEGNKVLPYCPRCETPIANAEIAMDNSYKEIKDISAYAKFRIKGTDDEYLVAWTTTPWTLPGNTALAVNAGVTYVKVRIAGEAGTYIVAKDLVEAVDTVLNQGKEKKEITVEEEIKGKKLVGLEYVPLFSYYADGKIENKEKGWKVYAADFVTTEEGTGIVHIAPAYGEDDNMLYKEEKLPIIHHVDNEGKFKANFAGDDNEILFNDLPVKPKENHQESDIRIIKYLHSTDQLLAKQKITHSYPHCYRCETPLFYNALPAWFINIQKVKKNILKQNKNINWVPEHLKEGRFHNSAEAAPDWNISRNRFWASPLPIWQCDECNRYDVIGSKKELFEKAPEFEGKIEDLHRPFIDAVTYDCKTCSGTMKRIPEVIDCWFESGSMPFAAKHYPMENEDWFKENFPAQFITEYIAQTRTWFYYTHALSVMLFGTHAFENVVTTGTVLAEDGSKMSKSKNNFPDPQRLLNSYGADAFRLYMMGSPLMKAEDLNFVEDGVAEMMRKIVLTFENIVSFYELFKGDFKPHGTLMMDIDHPLDQWLVMRVDETIDNVTNALDTYTIAKSVQHIEELMRDMSQWYVRRSRERFKGDDVLDKEQAIAVLGESILATIKMLAPLAPFLAERTYQSVMGDDKLYESVHLDEWPKTFKATHDAHIKIHMEEARDIVEAVHAARSEAGIKVRQPLSEMQAFTDKGTWQGSEALKKTILDEVNVHKFNTLDSLDDYDAYEQTIIRKKVGAVTIALNCEITEELRREGWAREFVRHVNNLRKEKGLTIDDNAVIAYATKDPAMQKTINEFKLNIEKQILGELKEEENNGAKIKIEDSVLTINIEKK